MRPYKRMILLGKLAGAGSPTGEVAEPGRPARGGEGQNRKLRPKLTEALVLRGTNCLLTLPSVWSIPRKRLKPVVNLGPEG